MSSKVKGPQQTNNFDAFSDSAQQVTYHAIEARNQSDPPSTSIRVRNEKSYNRPKNEYLRYSVPNSQVHLDLSYLYPENASVFPKDIYKKEPFGGSISWLIKPRDNRLLYTYSPDPSDGKERCQHTMTASRFGYDRFYHEYALGPWSSGKYQEPWECGACASDTPANMAPDRFYSAHYLIDPANSEFRKYNSANISVMYPQGFQNNIL